MTIFWWNEIGMKYAFSQGGQIDGHFPEFGVLPHFKVQVEFPVFYHSIENGATGQEKWPSEKRHLWPSLLFLYSLGLGLGVKIHIKNLLGQRFSACFV